MSRIKCYKDPSEDGENDRLATQGTATALGENGSPCGVGFLVLQMTDESELNKEKYLTVSLCKILSAFDWLLLI